MSDWEDDEFEVCEWAAGGRMEVCFSWMVLACVGLNGVMLSAEFVPA